MYLQVLWLGKDDCHTSWEKEKNIPTAVLHEFINQKSVNINDLCSDDSLGYKVHTLDVSTEDVTLLTPEKRRKVERMVVEKDNE